MKNTVDVRMSDEEKGLLAAMVGKRFDKYRCDEFHFRPAVYQIVGVYVEGQAYAIQNIEQTIDYFGADEDMGVLSVGLAPANGIASHVNDGAQIDTPINQYIQDIKLIEDKHIMADGCEVLFELLYTKAIVFVLPDREVVFEKDVWFSEDIIIYRGAHAESKIMTPSEELEDSNVYQFRAERTEQRLANQSHS